MRRGQGHGDHSVAVLTDVDVVDQPELVDVDRDFRVVDRLERVDDGRLEVAAGPALPLLLLAGEEAGKIVALALELRSHTGARRRSDVRHFFRLDLALLVHHPKIRFTCSIPRTKASMSELSLCAAKLARAVASTPSQRIKGCAQWWPARTATPASSNMVAVSCACTPSTLKLTIPAESSGP